MIVEKIRARYVEEAKSRRAPSGVPTGSKFGTCTAQLQQLLFKETSKPEPYQPRRIMVFEHGQRLEEWMNELINGAYPGLWGLSQQPFYYPVPIPDDATMKLIEGRLRKFKGDRNRSLLWGWPEDDFAPPKIKADIERRKMVVRGISARSVEQMRRDREAEKSGQWKTDIPPSVVLDRTNGLVYLACYIDGMIYHPIAGLTLVEGKSMSNWAFRRALLGEIEYGYRCQLIGSVVAADVSSALWLCVRKETMHWAEIGFRRDIDSTQIRFVAPNGTETSYAVVDRRERGHLMADDAVPDSEPIEFLGDQEWETAEAWTPYRDDVRPQMDARILSVLTYEEGAPLDREYGPDFRCRDCWGEGKRLCGYCKGSGWRLSDGTKPHKACGWCNPGAKLYSGKVGYLICKSCNQTGILETTTLPQFPCGYCAVVDSCYGREQTDVQLILAKGRRPEYRITRASYEKSGLTFTPPEQPERSDTEDTPEDESEEET